jgi:hypothetical protein
MSFIPTEIRKLEKDMYTNYRLMQKENDDVSNLLKEKEIKQISPMQLYKYIGKQKLMKTSDFSVLSGKAVPLLEEFLNKEKEEFLRKKDNKENIKSNHLQLRDIHNFHAVDTKNKVFIVFYLLPALYIFKGSKMRNMSYWRFFFLVPIIAAYPSINDAIRQYTTKTNAILMLFCLEKNYKNNYDFYSKYKKFMDDNDLEFREVKEIDPEKKIDIVKN